MFFDEEQILDLRLNVLNETVDFFVIVESIYNHRGEKRELIFDKNKFSKFKDKISYLVLENEPKEILKLEPGESEEKRGEKLILNGMARDYFQRENLNK